VTSALVVCSTTLQAQRLLSDSPIFQSLSSRVGTLENSAAQTVVKSNGSLIPSSSAYSINGTTGAASFGGLTASGLTVVPTRAVGDKSTAIATTAYVDRLVPIFPVNAYGADPTGATPSDAAVTAALNAIGMSNGVMTGQGCLVFGAGTYRFSAAIAVTLSQATRNNFCIRGQGPSATMLVWSQASSGITITTQGQSNNFQISDLAFLTTLAGGGTALSVTNTGAFGGGDANTSNVTNVYFAGDDKTTLHDNNLHYWNNAVITTAVSNVNYDGVSIAGAGLSGLGRGIVVQGNGTTGVYGLSANITRSFFYATEIGVIYGTYFQGLMVSQSTFVNGKYGLYSPPTSLYTDQMQVLNNEFDTTADGINVGNMTHLIVMGNLFFLHSSGTSAISIQSAQSSIIQGNVVNGPQTIPSNMSGVYAYASINNNGGVISGNQFYNMDTGVKLMSGAVNYKVSNNSYIGNNTNIANLGSNNDIRDSMAVTVNTPVGLGSGGVIALEAGSDIFAGSVHLTTGSSGAGNSGYFKLQFPYNAPNRWVCTFTPNDTTALWGSGGKFSGGFFSSSVVNMFWSNGSAVLSNSSDYYINYTCAAR
jgi:hypothetical protein